MAHRLDPLLRPRSIAVVGASAREGSVGYVTLFQLLKGKFGGDVFAVNPGRDEVQGVKCYPSIADIPQQIDHAVFAVSDERIEEALDQAIDHGVRAATIMSTLLLSEDTDPPLKDRIARKVADAGILLCGGNGMGFYNFNDHVWVCGFETRDHRDAGNVALISHSGSGMCGIVDVEGRIDFSLAVSTGQELSVGMADYLDFAVDMPGTKAVGLFMETIRDLDAMTAALEKARAKAIPVVAIKVGRTEFSARMARSHSGALVGNDSAYQAYFDRHGVLRADDMDELATALMLFAQPHKINDGGLVSMHDSGGIRQLVIDLADQTGTLLTALSPASVRKLEETLEPGLPPVNPLDSWNAGGPDWQERACGYMTTLLADPDAAIGAVMQDRTPDSHIAPEYLDYLRAAHRATGKPVCLVSGRQGSGSDQLAIDATREGIPVIDGFKPFLKGVKHLFDYREFLKRPAGPAVAAVDQGLISKWRNRLRSTSTIDEATGAELFADFGIPALPYQIATSANQAVAAAELIGYPVVLKTAEPGIEHKSDVGGVKLNLASADQVRLTYKDMAARLGKRIAVTRMIDETGVEMILGATQDERFGPLVMLGFGGIYAETLKDVAFLLPPFDAASVRHKLDGLKLSPLLDGQRGAAPADIDSFAQSAAHFSVMVAALGDVIAEIDINPMLVTNSRSIALDALVVPLQSAQFEKRTTG